MGLISLIMRVLSAILLFLLAFKVIDTDYLLWLAGALGLYVAATCFGGASLSGIVVNKER